MKTVYGHQDGESAPCWHELSGKDSAIYWAQISDEKLVAREVSETRVVSIR